LANLTPAEDALLFAAAMCEDPQRCPNSALQRLAPNVPVSAARFRANLHRAMRVSPIELPDFPHGHWLAPPHTEWSGLGEPAVLREITDGPRFFPELGRLLSIAPIDRYTGPPRVQPLWGTLFEQVGPEMVFVPRVDADVEALVGVGRWLAWLWRAGEAVPIRFSRAVIRLAFGGIIRRDDIADVDPELATRDQNEIDLWEKTREVSFTAIRAGVLAAGLVVDDDVIVPRLFQIRPFRIAHGMKRKADPWLTPIIRQVMWDENIGLWSKRGELIDEIIERFD
jgi:hypothetical protein